MARAGYQYGTSPKKLEPNYERKSKKRNFKTSLFKGLQIERKNHSSCKSDGECSCFKIAYNIEYRG